MNYTELSLEKLREISVSEAQRIKNEYEIDLIIYVAKAGFPIAFFMNEIFNSTLLGINAQRKGNKIKKIIGPLIAFIPNFVRNFLISMELKSKVHKKDIERNVYFHESIKNIDIKSIKTIIVVDDSVDTGHSMKLCVEKIKEMFSGVDIITYSLNVWKQSFEVFETDFYTFEDTIIRAPMSKDSKEYKKFIDMYRKETNNGNL